MKAIERVGPYVHIIEARSPENHLSHVKVGIIQSSMTDNVGHALSVKCAEFYGIVQEGLVDAVHAFRGLNRPLLHGDDMEADKRVVAYSWRPKFDYVWSHGRFHGNPTPRIPPNHVVFVVLVREDEKPQTYPGHGLIFGSVEHWSWIAEDPTLAGAPIEYEERYAKKLWSRDL